MEEAAARPARANDSDACGGPKASTMSQGGFEIVTRGSKRCARGKGRGPRYVPSASADQDDELSPDEIVAKVTQSSESLQQTGWYREVLDLVLSHLSCLDSSASGSAAGQPAGFGVAGEMVCYGIGHFSRSRASGLQAALALLLKEACGVSGKAWLFDPVLTPNEQTAAETLGFALLEENEVGLRVADGVTLFYMPHCGRRLYSNVLRANWTPRQLANVAIFGNSFEEYGLRLLDASARGSCCVSRLATCDLCCEAVLPAFSDQGSFQDMSMHSFPPARLAAIAGDAPFWDLPPDRGGDDHGWA